MIETGLPWLAMASSSTAGAFSAVASLNTPQAVTNPDASSRQQRNRPPSSSCLWSVCRMELECVLSYLTHLRRLFFGWDSAISASSNIECMMLSGIWVPAALSISPSGETAPLQSSEGADSAAECALRPGRLFLGLPMVAGWDVSAAFPESSLVIWSYFRIGMVTPKSAMVDRRVDRRPPCHADLPVLGRARSVASVIIYVEPRGS